jgi:hypothetical protein
MGKFSSLGGGRSGAGGSAGDNGNRNIAVAGAGFGDNEGEKRGRQGLKGRGYVYHEREINLDKTLPGTPTRSMSDDSSIGEEMAIVRVIYDDSGKR